MVVSSEPTVPVMLRLPPPYAFLSFVLLLYAACDTTAASENPDVTIRDLLVGEGQEAVNGADVTIRYVGRLDDGKVFDSTYKEYKMTLPRDTSFMFTLGAGIVILGLDRGIPGMRVGGKRRIIIPPQLGYGGRGVCSADSCRIPPDATLRFDVDLIDVIAPRTGGRP